LIETVPDILARIIAKKREELSRTVALRPDLELRAQAVRHRDFRAVLAARNPAIIAEIKKASPSKGLLAKDFDPPRLAREYASGGAAALSVLTDAPFFQGSLAYLEAARAAVELPVLRKDFTIHEVQVIEAAAHGADAILLIAAILEEQEIRDLRELAGRYGLAALVEVHREEELAKAVGAGADIIGVNNRNLTTFEVSLEVSLRLAESIPPGVLRVAESGIHSGRDVRRLRAAGFSVFLVGEHLVRSGDPAASLRALVADA
jgi:indole-3-glycerol phosphate synthase